MQEVPSQLSVPWCALSELIGLPPVITLATVSLSNYRIVDPLRYDDNDSVIILIAILQRSTRLGLLDAPNTNRCATSLIIFNII